jgi:hypothetical protein
MGQINEERITPFIKERYGEDMEILTDCSNDSHYEAIDYRGKNSGNVVEVKSRSFKYSDWIDTMVGFNKVEEYRKLIEQGKRCWFVFMFIDGTYEWEFTEENYRLNYEAEKKLGKIAVRKASNTYKKGANYTSFNPDKLHLYIVRSHLVSVSKIEAYVPDDLIPKPYKPYGGLLAGVCYLKVK